MRELFIRLSAAVDDVGIFNYETFIGIPGRTTQNVCVVDSVFHTQKKTNKI